MSTITAARFTAPDRSVVAVEIDGETSFVPEGSDGPAAFALAAWRAEGNVVAPPPPDAVPVAVTNFQARAALIAAGLFETVDAAVKSAADPVALQAWEYANEVHRHGHLVTSFAARLGLGPEALDALFRRAATIDA